jgi:hypothetical protein
MIPPLRALVTVDAEGYSRNSDAELPGLHAEIRHAVECACERSGLGGVWRDIRVLQSTGDGLLAVLPYDAAALLIHPFADRLQEALAQVAPRLRGTGLSLRLRVAVHLGLVDDEHPVTGGISSATNDVSRLLDCEPLRVALSDSDPNVTFAAMIVSSQAYDWLVRGGRTGMQPSQFTPVSAKVKQFDQVAYLYVPVPSRRVLSENQPGARTASGESLPVPPGGLTVSRVSVTGNASQNVIGNQVGGSIRQKRA